MNFESGGGKNSKKGMIAFILGISACALYLLNLLVFLLLANMPNDISIYFDLVNFDQPLISLILSLLGIYLGVWGINKEKMRKLSILGLVANFISIILFLATIILSIARPVPNWKFP